MHKTLKKENKTKRVLIGTVNIIDDERPYCFIDTKGSESYFCYKSDLPIDIGNGSQVTFDAVPSFDNKKNKDSWKAVNIEIHN